MARFKDANWNLTTTSNGSVQTWEQAQLAVMMDLRDELKRLNSLLYCPNFTGIPTVLRSIQRNTSRIERPARKLRSVVTGARRARQLRRIQGEG